MPDTGAFSRREFALAILASGGGVRRELERREPELPDGLELTRAWQGDVCKLRLKNRGSAAVRPGEIALFEWRHGLPGRTRVYGEGFQMLSQTGGTLDAQERLGGYGDAEHYRIPSPAGAATVYNVLVLSPEEDHHYLLAFASCRRFVGRFHLRPGRVTVACDLERLALEPGESWELEDFVAFEGKRRGDLLERLAGLLKANHPIKLPETPPRGWCSWVAYAGNVTGAGVLENARAAKDRAPWLKYIQIDGGYMERLGDWFTPSAAFGGSVKDTLLRVKELGLEPGLWLAPFIAERQSEVLARHPKWFVQDEAGAPLAADRVTFGGWKRPPWFVLDGTNPEVQEHLERVLRTLHEEWGSTYFKLDANFWGAMHGGRFHDAKATRVEAYRSGMAAVRRGAGHSFLLGCNHPIWPSLGLVEGSRSSNDIEPKWASVAATTKENLSRSWQNGRIWWNDPDTVQFQGALSAAEVSFHLAVQHAAQGILMSSDLLGRVPAEQMARLARLTEGTGGVAEFDSAMREGTARTTAGRVLYWLNWSDGVETRRLPKAREIRDFWTNERIDGPEVPMESHSGRVFLVR